MSSIVFRNGRGEIQFRDGSKRKTLRLGTIAKQQAKEVRRHVDFLLSAKMSRQPLPAPTAEWIGEITTSNSVLVARLVKLGLISAPAISTAIQPESLNDLCSYVTARYDNGKPNTLKNMQQTANWLLKYFPSSTMASITKGDADEFREYLLEQGQAATTTTGICRKARRFFNIAIDKGWTDFNPFGHMKQWVHTNKDRSQFISESIAETLIDACEPEWQLIVALVRYGGLRCPSEVKALRWDMINWDRSRFVVMSPKNERFEAKKNRVCPIFPRLRPHLDRAWDRAPKDGSVFVVDRVQGCTAAAIYGAFKRRIARAGLEPWPKLFMNLRASLETDLVDAGFPLPTITRWLGNSPKIAEDHYLMDTERQFEAATQSDSKNRSKFRSKIRDKNCL